MIDVRNIQDFKEFIDNLLVNSECDDIEFKSAAGGFLGTFWDTYSAFANSEGGVIELGVAEIADILKEMCVDGWLVNNGYGRDTTYILPQKVGNSTAERLEAQDVKVGSSMAERLDADNKNTESVKPQRMSYEALSHLICEFTSTEWLTPEQLSQKTGKQISYLKNKILPCMIADGQSEMLYPNNPITQ